MAKHLNYKSCPKCDEFLKVADARLKKWFTAQKEKDPSLHISCSVRDKATQTAALASGASKAAFGKSPHNYSPALALDLFWIIDGKAIFEKSKYETLAKTMPKDIEWGGAWVSFQDMPHFQVKNWKSFAKNYPNGNE